MRLTKSLRKFEREFDLRAEKFIWKHQLLGFITLFVGMPLFILFCVCISAIVIAFPMAWFFGWL